ncbi:hypothetical protein [Nocardia coubleae]|uniref:Uncharacterized protein n=1 Tax=Nocardia coubleae TaxID=356147 RepID=A0A846W1X8_9NOCA|nr:hypothetical protein [Nocardia coubleae]NKX86893.1 hypothetical protein [Nocardia coubleae]
MNSASKAPSITICGELRIASATPRTEAEVCPELRIWDTDGETPQRERDREQPVRNLMADEVSELGWRAGRSAVGWVITILITTIKIVVAVIAVLVLAYYLGR